MCVSVEELSWGDAGLYLTIPNPGLGGAAVAAAGTPAQKERFLARFSTGEPKWAAMAITEPGCGSDSSAIQTTAVRDGDHCVLNGTKIFCTSGLMAAEKSDGFVVVWATLDKSAGRGGHPRLRRRRGHAGHVRHEGRAQARHPRLRHRDDRVRGLPRPGRQHPRQRGDPEDRAQGFKGAMATFDATRPIVAASALGVGRAALDFVLETLAEKGVTIRYGAPPAQADGARARRDGDGGAAAGRPAPHLAGRVDDGQRASRTTSRPRWPRRKPVWWSPRSRRRRSS